MCVCVRACVSVCVCTPGAGVEPQSPISMAVSYSLAAVEASPETWNDREEIPGKGSLHLCLQELRGKCRPAGCGIHGGRGEEMGNELGFSNLLSS